jgi:hypothetical protein
MKIKPNVLQGAFFWLFGAGAATACGLMLLPVMIFFAPAKADYGDFPEYPISNVVGLTVLVSSFVAWTAAYVTMRHRMHMTLPTGTKASLFALGMLVNNSIGLVAYFWARAVL